MPPRAFHIDAVSMARTYSFSSHNDEESVEVMIPVTKRRSVSFQNTVDVIKSKHTLYKKKECWYDKSEYAAIKQANLETIVRASSTKDDATCVCTRGLEKGMRNYKEGQSCNKTRFNAIHAVLREQERQIKRYGKVNVEALRKISELSTASQRNQAIALAASDAMMANDEQEEATTRLQNSPRVVAVFDESPPMYQKQQPQLDSNKLRKAMQKQQQCKPKRQSHRALLMDGLGRVFCNASTRADF